MTENEVKAIKWMKSVRDDAVVTLDHIEKNEPNVSPMLYARRKESAEMIIKGFEELEQYRSTGTVKQFREAMERQKAKKPVLYEGTNRADCPVCGKTVRGIGKPFGNWCNGCGQAVDWGSL